jgi:hypothetical protein
VNRGGEEGREGKGREGKGREGRKEGRKKEDVNETPNEGTNKQKN